MMVALNHADLLFAEGYVLAAGCRMSEARPKFHECAEIRRCVLGRQVPTARALFMESRQISSWSDDKERAWEEREALLIEARSIFEEQVEYDVTELAMIIDELGLLYSEHHKNEAHRAEAKALRALARSMVPHSEPGDTMVQNRKRFETESLTAAIALLTKDGGSVSVEITQALICQREWWNLGSEDVIPGRFV